MAVLDLMPASLTAMTKGTKHRTDGLASIVVVPVEPEISNDLFMNHVRFHP